MSSDAMTGFRAAAEGFFEQARELVTPHVEARPPLALRLALMEELAGLRESATSVDAVMAHAEADRSTACLSLGLIARRAFLRREPGTFVHVASLQRSLSSHPLDAEAGFAARCSLVWIALLGGDAASIDIDALAALEKEAAHQCDAYHVLECAILRGWALLETGSEEATKAVRRAARMAQTEGIPQQQYLAHSVLARLRRVQQRPHLALRIVGSLRRVAPPIWSPWLAWESELAGKAADAPITPFVLACARSSAEEVRRSLSSALESAADYGVFRDDILALRDALILGEDCATLAAAEWRRGLRPFAPRGVQAASLVSSSGEDVLAYVAAPPRGAGQRVLFQGLGQLDVSLWRQLPQSQRKRGRMETATAALALAGEGGLREADLFAAVYGFGQEPGVHDGVLDVVLHRLRGWLEGHGSVQREREHVHLTHEGLLIPDPRCAVPLDDRVLARLAQSPASAGDLATGLDLPLRTVQRMLKRLTAEQSCLKEREGRAVVYRVEDTTFQEPTRV